jgi:perosamine synthetase
MKLVARQRARPSSPPTGSVPWIPLFPTLWPSMVRPVAELALPFPFDHPHRRDFMFARYGIFALAQALGLAGREVLFPSFFHCVELEALLAAGARVRFYSVDSRLDVDPAEIATLIGSQTAAVYVIHYAGFPAPIRELGELCRNAGLALIEDCALALLSYAGDEPLGSFGDAAVFSLPKSLPTPDGGVAILRAGWPDDPRGHQAASRAWLAAHTASLVLSNLEMRRVPAAARVRAVGRRIGKAAYSAAGAAYVPMGTPDFDLGKTTRTISDTARRIVRTQDFSTIVERRRANYRFLLGRLDGVIEPILRGLPDGVCPLFLPFVVRDRDGLMTRLRARGVQIGEFWPERYRLRPDREFPVAAELHRALWLPCHQDLTIETLAWLADAVRGAV